MVLSLVKTSKLDSPSLAPGVGGKPPGIGGFVYDSSLAFPVPGLVAVVGREACVFCCGVDSLVGSSGSDCARKMDSRRIFWLGVRWGTARPFAFNRSSVARNLASSSSSSVACDTTACFLWHCE